MSQTPSPVLDITAEVCPMTLVRVRLALDRVAPGGVLTIRMAGGEPVASIPRVLREEGHELLSVTRSGAQFEVVVRKAGDP